jgi:hypothetical protein
VQREAAAAAQVPPPRTKWTRRVPHPVLIGHATSPAAQAQAADFGHAMQASEAKLAHAHAGLRELNATVARFAAREEALVARLASAESDRAGLLHEREELQHQLHSLRERFGEVLPCASLPARRPRVRLPPRAVGAQGGRAGGECVGWGGAIRAQAKGARRLASTLTAKSRPDGRAARATTRSPSRRVCNREERAQVRARMQELQVQVAQLEQERDLARDGLRALQAEHEALTRRVAVSRVARPQPLHTTSRFTRICAAPSVHPPTRPPYRTNARGRGAQDTEAQLVDRGTFEAQAAPPRIPLPVLTGQVSSLPPY